MKPMRSALPFGLLLTLAAVPCGADNLNSAAQQMFNDLGAVGNITAPQAFRGQTLNTYTGGSLFIRTPTKNYQLATLQLPYIRAGCGGIDAFGGSFSHISASQFKDMLKNVTSALPGVMFQMMLKSVEPLFGSTLEWFKGIETAVNRQNIGSCETAQSIVASASQKLGFSTTKACETTAMALGLADDGEAARRRCASSGDVNSVISAGAGNAATNKLPPFTGNLVWASLKKWPHLDDSDRELIMSLTGTTIYPRASDDAAEPQTYSPTIRSTGDLLYGNASGSGTVPAGQVQVKTLRCGEPTECLNVTETIETMPSLTTRVTDIMRSLSAKMAGRTGAPTTAEQNFVNSVPLPVYRLLAASNAINNPAVAEAKIGQYADYVAIEFAYALLSRTARLGMDAGQLNATLQDSQAAQMAMHRDNGRQLLATLHADRSTAEAKAKTFIAIAADIEQLERNLRSNMPQQVADLLSYSSQPGGR